MEILHRLFFCIRPPDNIARDMAALPAASGWPRKANRADRLHMTLAITEDFQDMPRHVIDAFGEIGDIIAAQPFRLSFDRAVASKSLLILLSTERLSNAEFFQKILARRIALAGLPLRRGVRFNPHITLSYQRGNPFDEQIDSFSWLAKEFLLIHSHIGLTRHDVVGRWQLGAYGLTASPNGLFAEC